MPKARVYTVTDHGRRHAVAFVGRKKVKVWTLRRASLKEMTIGQFSEMAPVEILEQSTVEAVLKSFKNNYRGKVEDPDGVQEEPCTTQ